MLVAWVYVVPPLQDASPTQADRRERERPPAPATDRPRADDLHYSRGQLVIVNSDAVTQTLNIIGARFSGRAIIYARSLVPVRDSPSRTAPDVSDYPMLEETVRTGRSPEGTVTTATGRAAATAVPLFTGVDRDHSGGGGTRRAIARQDVDNAVAAVQRQLLFATALALGISLLLGYMASYFIARRLKRIERSAEAIAGGDLPAKVPETVEDEIGQLADTFNVMADRLRSAFAQVEYERDRVEVLLNDLSEGVIGVSADGNVTIANPAAAILLDAQALVGETVDDALPADVAQLWPTRSGTPTSTWWCSHTTT